MKETKTCPFCGHLPIVGKDSKDYWNITCETIDCPGENDLWWETYDEAVKAWNRRYEPTCKMKHERGEDTNESHIFVDKWTCSECGSWWMYPPYHLGDARFCPHCGRKVIEE